jgi:hypothetical protein
MKIYTKIYINKKNLRTLKSRDQLQRTALSQNFPKMKGETAKCQGSNEKRFPSIISPRA